MKAKIYLKSGASLEFDIEGLTTSRHAITNGFTGMKWTTPDDWTSKLHTIEMDQVAAIVIVRDPSEAEG